MVQQKSLGVFTAPAPLPNRIKPCASWGLPPPKVLPPTTSAALRPISAPEREILAFLAHLSEPMLSSPALGRILSEIKGHLFNREYEQAFGGPEEYREAYAARWVPSRALIYRKIFKESPEIMALLAGGSARETRKVVCLGGGAGSEVVALASVVSRIVRDEAGPGACIAVDAVDSCDWGAVIRGQDDGMRGAWGIEGRFATTFVQADVLTSAKTLPPSIDYTGASLITLLFTVSELFLQSRAATVALLAHITASAAPGTLFLVVESASLSEIAIGTTGRTYPLGTLLDYNLCDDKGLKGGDGKWARVRKDESTWYRMPEDAGEHYPLKLEGSRTLVRLYRRV